MLWSDWLVHPRAIPDSFPRGSAFPAHERALSPEMPRFTLLNSHVRHRSQHDAPWIRKSIELLGSMQPGRDLMVTSIGMLQFDLPLSDWLLRGGRALVLTHPRFFTLPHHHRQMYQWFFNHPCVCDIPISAVLPARSSDRSHHVESVRDLLMGALSHTLLPGEILKGGRMEQLCDRFHLKVTPIAARSQARTSHTGAECIRVKSAGASGILESHLWHFTRELDHPWPDSGWDVYCRDLLDPGTIVPYPAIDVLIRILMERRIRASAHLLRGREPMVCFTGAPMNRIPKLFTWQNHLNRLRFSPYGIGIARQRALDLGFRPVSYSDGSREDGSGDSPGSFTHPRGVGRWDWRDESEFRVRGDVRLDRLDPRECIVIVRKESERLRFVRMTPFPVISWEALV